MRISDWSSDVCSADLGSITGAPKLSAMEIIHEVEHCTRGPYCGSIGEFAKTGAGHEDGGRGGWRSRFNVAIRTLRLTPETSASEGSAVFGVGSGIVADSVVEDEWAECLLKARFVDRAILTAQNPRLSAATISCRYRSIRSSSAMHPTLPSALNCGSFRLRH